MSSVQEGILEHTNRLPEGALIAPKSFLHLGSRAAVDQALSRMARDGELLRITRGWYVRPRPTRFGPRAPSSREVVEQLSRATGETVVPSGAVAAHGLGLTTQVPVRTVYLTSGAGRRLQLGSQVVELRKAPSWQLWGAGTREGAVLRAVDWMGPEAGPEVVGRAVSSLTPEEKERLLLGCASAPTWLAERLTRALFPDATGVTTVRNG
jgi:hypothetical protein